MRARPQEPEVELELVLDEPTVAAPDAVRDFDAFYVEEYPRVVRLLVGLTGRNHIAEELAQEAMLSAHKRWRHVQAMDRPDLWLRRVAVNRAISSHRRVVTEVAALARLRSGDTAVADVEGTDEHLWSEIRKLPRRQGAALVLWAVEDLTLDEVGEVLGCSGETARTHLRRARERLAAVLEGERS